MTTFDYANLSIVLASLVELTEKVLVYYQVSVYRVSVETFSQNADEMLGRSPLMQNG